MRFARCAPLLLILVALLQPARADDVYRTVDKDGRVIFSDRPTEGAEPVRVGPTNTMTEAAPTAPAPDSLKAAEGPVRPYTSVAITEPADGDTVSDPSGSFTVRYRIEPQRRADDAVRLMVDGQPAGTNTAEGVHITGATRGDHRLQLQVVDREGKLLGQSSSVRILVVRAGKGKNRPG